MKYLVGRQVECVFGEIINTLTYPLWTINNYVKRNLHSLNKLQIIKGILLMTWSFKITYIIGIKTS